MTAIRKCSDELEIKAHKTNTDTIVAWTQTVHVLGSVHNEHRTHTNSRKGALQGGSF